MNVEEAIAKALAGRQGQPGWVTTGFASKHFGADRDFNENNYGLGYRSAGGWGAGGYKNSLGKTSLYGTKEFSTEPGPLGIQGTLNVGAVTGYGPPITPVLMPGLKVGNENLQAALGLVPPVPGVTPATLALQLRKRLP